MSSGYVRRSSEVAARDFDGQMVIMQLATSALFTLNQVGARIWELADGRMTADQIVQRICQEFEVEKAVAERDARDFIERLAKHGVLLLSDTPAQAGSRPLGDVNGTDPR